MRVLIVFGLVLTIVGCAASEPGIPDRDIGLSKAAITDVPTPPEVTINAVEPGESALLARAFDESPPVIPHGITEFLPITLEDNMCLECHQVQEAVEGEPTPIPASHYTDYRNSPDEVGDEVVGSRNECTLCHVPTTDASPLMDNRFGG